MGHYDSCREETWAIKKELCSGSKLDKYQKVEFDKQHKWYDDGYGIQRCKNCDKVIFYT